MRTVIIALTMALFPSSPVLALQLPPGGAGGGGGEPLLVKSQEPDLSTDAASLDEVRHNMQHDKRTKRSGAKADAARPAQVSDIVAGKAVYDISGKLMATVEKVTGEGAVLRSGERVIMAPLEGFGVNKSGLLLNLKKAQFDEMLLSSGVKAPKS